MTDDQAAEMPYWQSFRSLNGLDTSPERIIEIAKTRQGKRTLEEYGTPLSRRDERQVLKRWQTDDEADEVLDMLMGRPDFGGLFVDHPGGGTVHINFTELPPRSEQRDIRRMFTQSNLVHFHEVEHSLVSLHDAIDEIGDAMENGLPSVSEVRTDVPENRLVISVDPAPAAAAIAARSVSDEDQLSAMLDVPFVIEESAGLVTEACTSWVNCDGPYRGGIQMAVLNGAGVFTGYCTVGFIATDSAGNDFALSAGHCADPTGGQSISGGAVVGNDFSVANLWAKNAFKPDGTVDAAALAIPDNKKSHHVYKRNNTPFVPMTSVKTTNNYSITSQVCASGPKFGTTYCGTILDDNVITRTPEPYRVVQRRQVKWEMYWPGSRSCDFNVGVSSGGGQSGGPVFKNKKALGMHTGCVLADTTSVNETGLTRMNLTFSKIRLIEQRLQMSVRTSSSP